LSKTKSIPVEVQNIGPFFVREIVLCRFRHIWASFSSKNG
jgi:hypothetical protein